MSVLLAALAFSGLSLLLTMQGEQLRWVERGGQSTAGVSYAGGTYSKGTTTPYGIVSVQSESIVTDIDPATVFFVDVKALDYELGGSLTGSVTRRASTASDCGR